MSAPTSSSTPEPVSSEQAELQSMLFLDLVAQHANLALIFLGQVPHPETGKRVRELETARHFVEQLEMLEVKTRGNLNKREETLLKQSLMAVRMAFVAAVEQSPAPSAGSGQAPSGANPVESPAGAAPSDSPAGDVAPAKSAPDASSSASTTPSASTSDAAQDDERKKFVKKY